MHNLVCFSIAHHKATLDKIAVYPYNEGGKLHFVQVMYKQLRELWTTKNKVSTKVYQALATANCFRAYTSCNFPQLLRVRGVPCSKLIDVDEFGLTLEKSNQTGGLALI
jgi:hypothetical protein